MLRRLIILGGVVLASALGNWNDTSTGIDLKKLPHPPLTRVRAGWLREGARVTFDGITATALPGEVRLRGIGKSGRHWEARARSLDEVWRGDLDGNGVEDYVLFNGGPFLNGRTTPLFSMTILLMDKDAMPAPFFTLVYQGENGDGIRHLVDFENDGRAELLIGTYDERVSDPLAGTFGSGHWVTQLYRIRNLRFEEVVGIARGIEFPFAHDWSYRKLYGVVEGSKVSVQPPTIGDHGTSTTGEITTRVLKVADSGWLNIAPTRGCKSIEAMTVVNDSAPLREISLPNPYDDYRTALIERIRGHHIPSTFSGVNRVANGDCSANLMWAKP